MRTIVVRPIGHHAYIDFLISKHNIVVIIKRMGKESLKQTRDTTAHLVTYYQPTRSTLAGKHVNDYCAANIALIIFLANVQFRMSFLFSDISNALMRDIEPGRL
jgi:hypothetical protein